MIDGRTTHAIRKTARAGIFGCRTIMAAVHPHVPAADERAFAGRRWPRVRRVRCMRGWICPRDPAGGFRLMELELVEPELFFRFHPPAAQAL